jgi:hypothetical protein
MIMTKLIAMAVPILPGKTEQWKKFSNDLKNRYSKEYNESREDLEVRERTFFQSTPNGDLIVLTLEGKNPEAAFQKFGQGKDEFTKWFVSQVKEIHGLDLTKQSDFKVPQLVVESKPISEHVQS